VSVRATTAHLLLATGLGLALQSGCAAGRAAHQPVMAAATRESGYGYSATKLAGDRYELSYITPPLSLATDPKSRAVQIEAQEQQAYDLALWRAAEMALAAGFDRLVVSDRKAQLQPITPYQPPAPGVYGPGGMIYPQWIYNPGVSYYGAPGIG